MSLESLHDVNDKVTNTLFTSFMSMANANGKAPVVSAFAMTT